MLKVVAKNMFEKENLEKVIALYQELIAETRKEQGCISYELYQDIDNPCIFAVIETWENKACLEAHFEAAHFKRLVPEIGKLKISEKDMHVYIKIA